MCGIVGYCGNSTEVLDTLINGLKRLEYRGYDSAGIAIVGYDSSYVKKAVGKVANLEAAIQDASSHRLGNTGIAHTRWATHGEPTTANAHPHSSADGKIWVVHNGIVENYQQLKAKLVVQGLRFDSQTDTEVVAKLIGTNYRGELKQAVLNTLPKLKGAFSLCVVSQDEPDRMIGVKMASPLVVGSTANETIISSDVAALVGKAKQVVYLEDGELVDVKSDQYSVSTFGNRHKRKVASDIDWAFEAATKQGYGHFLLKEIMEQPQVIQDTIRGRIDLAQASVKFGGLIDVSKHLKNIRRVVLVGMGTAFYAAKLGELYFSELSSVPAQAVMSSEFRYTKQIVDKQTWVIAVSQSGETADTIAAIEVAKQSGALVTGVVNVVGSTISRITGAGVYNHIGPEISVASTKAFTSQSLLLLMHSVLLGRQRGLHRGNVLPLLKGINKLPSQVSQLLNGRRKIARIAKLLASSDNLIYIGRQYNYPIALEGALKIKEIAYIHAEGLSAGELKHGFIALIDNRMPTIALATDDAVFDKMLANMAEVKARRGPIVAVANHDLSEVDHTIIVPKSSSPLLQPLLNIVPLQLIAYYVADERKVDIDQPRNLAKSVTVE